MSGNRVSAARLGRYAEPEDEGAYQPWGSSRDGSRPAFLDLRRADGTGEMIAYPYIIRIAYSGDSLISLICVGGQAVTIEGLGLGELVRQLQAQAVAFVQEIDFRKRNLLSTDNPVMVTLMAGLCCQTKAVGA